MPLSVQVLAVSMPVKGAAAAVDAVDAVEANSDVRFRSRESVSIRAGQNNITDLRSRQRVAVTFAVDRASEASRLTLNVSFARPPRMLSVAACADVERVIARTALQRPRRWRT